MSLDGRCSLKAKHSIWQFSPICAGNENPIVYIGHICPLLFVQLPLSCDVIEWKLLEPQLQPAYYDGRLKCVYNYTCFHNP